ncbi:TMV resistance protein N-like [Rhodamnia argentea]|uniref:TMV resistance protein N-like n=1 Tax=Rhodamnia argentea TaxID=178133 RepID=A0ABM3HA98_9MYRT|nr:TMV resistance protein N-like [Rhodamnia argentea]
MASYHVFLSFRGEDVRNNFLSHLYDSLNREGIFTYVDSEELRKGEQIAPALMKAIEESQIAIIIFSEDYAFSRWCLEEVAKIMNCKEERDLIVFPVFYKVEPKEVRTPRDNYKKAMLEHESKIGKDSEEVKRWKKALFDATSLSGWHLKDENESEFIQRIVMEISAHVNRAPLHVAKYTVRIDSQVAKLESMLNLQSDDDVLMMGLWGKGGIGKTTLAKSVYNKIFKQFEGSCFLRNVREVSKNCKDLATLQENLLFEVLKLKERLVVSSVDRGINQIQERLCRKKVLLIFDDVDDLRQLNALAGECKWFGNGSRIIVTTRDRHVLTSHGIDLDHVYEVKELDKDAAHELLSKHAFPTHQKFEIRTDLVDGVLNHAKGLPLALEVLGSFLRGRREDVWESALDKVSMSPKKDINDVLKISYDGLETNEKEIFLHIACFFKGRETKYILNALDSCDFKVVIGLQILTERSLISIESKNIVEMHGLIQLMGMDIVIQESADPGRRSRLWFCDDAIEVVSSDMDFQFLKHVNFGNCESLVCLPNFRCTPNLEELNISDCKDLVEAHPSIADHDQLQKWSCCGSLLPGGEMPQWILPNEERFVSFMASQDIYDKILGMVLCFVLSPDEQGKGPVYLISTHVNGEMWIVNSIGGSHSLDSEHVFLDYYRPTRLWGEVDFCEIDGNYAEFGVTIVSKNMRKLGSRIICKHLGDDAELRDNQLIDLALFYEVDCESTDSVATSSLMHEDSSSEADRQKDLRDCEMAAEKHSQIISKRSPLEACELGLRGLLIEAIPRSVKFG